MAPSASIPILGSLPGIAWPPVPGPEAAQSLVQLLALEGSQWWSPEQLRARQTPQLRELLEHAISTVPFYRERLAGIDIGEAASPEGWPRLPLLTRRDIQTAGERLFSERSPQQHGALSRHMTSGSTGQPVLVLGTAVTRATWRTLTLRDHLWHRRDFRAQLAAIRFTEHHEACPPHGRQLPDWGLATRGVVPTGPSVGLSLETTPEEQADWLLRVDPEYLLAYPSTVGALVEIFRDRGVAPRRLREIRTFGEIVEPGLRDGVGSTFGTPLVDLYSSHELGYIALQCPDHPRYHVQSESVLVEVLDAEGAPCGPGETGRLVITSLHNFASPLIRYDLGDFAEVADACPCGRGLPTLERIVGRQRNMLVLPDGRRRWPSFGAGARPDELPPFFQFQLVQTSLQHIRVNVVRPGPFSPEEAERVRAYLTESLGAPFGFDFLYVDDIPRSPCGKFEDFRSELPPSQEASSVD